jgi:hypothetical protein
MIKLSAPSPVTATTTACSGEDGDRRATRSSPRGEDGGAGKIGGSHIREERKMG